MKPLKQIIGNFCKIILHFRLYFEVKWLKKKRKRNKIPPTYVVTISVKPTGQEQLQVALSWYLPHTSFLQQPLNSAESGPPGCPSLA